jgi:hypothetical protein
MYKIRNNEFPESLTSMFNTSNNKNYNLRSNELDFSLPKPNTNYLKKSLSYSGAALWNDLLECAKDRAISVGQLTAILNNMEERACK